MTDHAAQHGPRVLPAVHVPSPTASQPFPTSAELKRNAWADYAEAERIFRRVVIKGEMTPEERIRLARKVPRFYHFSDIDSLSLRIEMVRELYSATTQIKDQLRQAGGCMLLFRFRLMNLNRKLRSNHVKLNMNAVVLKELRHQNPA